uniref:RING-type domain-containing protein n=1 Tax=viral metagenome TaxID=1070528 RepID=A0A6C0CFN9_9ZZZZ
MLTCQATLKRGNRKCSRQAGDDGFCYQHRKAGLPKVPEVDITCTVCFDDLTTKDDAGLQCRHALHMSCAKQLRDAHCPACRAEITIATSKLSEKQLATIRSRCLEDKNERAEESFRSYMDQDDDVQPIRIDQNLLVQALGRLIPNQGSFDGEDFPFLVAPVRDRVVPMVIFRNPAPGSAEELNLLSWILEQKMGGIEICESEFHEELHFEHPNYSCEYLAWAQNKADTFLED